MLMQCPNCGNCVSKNFFIKTKEVEHNQRMNLFDCEKCGLIFSQDYQKDRTGLYGENYAAWGGCDAEKEKKIAKSKKRAFAWQIGKLLSFINPKRKKLLDIGAGRGYLMEVAKELGFDCYGTEISSSSVEIIEKKFPQRIHLGDLSDAKYPANFFDVITLTDVLEHLVYPQIIMQEIKRILRPGGYLLIISPNSKSLTREFLGSRWFQYKYEHIFYYNKKSLQYLLEKYGFSLVKFENNVKTFSLDYYYYYFKKYSFSFVGFLGKMIFPILPKKIKTFHFPNPITGEFLAIIKK